MEIVWEIPTESSPLYPLTITIKENERTTIHSFYQKQDKEVLKKLKEYLIQKDNEINNKSPFGGFVNHCPRLVPQRERKGGLGHYSQKILTKGAKDKRYYAFRDNTIQFIIDSPIGAKITNQYLRGEGVCDLDFCTNGETITTMLNMCVCRGLLRKEEYSIKTSTDANPVGDKYIRIAGNWCEYLERNPDKKFKCSCPKELIERHSTKK